MSVFSLIIYVIMYIAMSGFSFDGMTIYIYVMVISIGLIAIYRLTLAQQLNETIGNLLIGNWQAYFELALIDLGSL